MLQHHGLYSLISIHCRSHCRQVNVEPVARESCLRIRSASDEDEASLHLHNAQLDYIERVPAVPCVLTFEIPIL